MSQNDLSWAEQARNDYDILLVLRGSELGRKLFRELKRIEKQATDSAMLGRTPQDNNKYMEGRGKMLAVSQIKRLFKTVDADNDRATEIYQRANEEKK